MLKLIPKHKGTDKLQADLKSKIAKLKVESSQPKSTAAGKGFKLPVQGAARILFIGPPNSGKSQLLCTITRAHSEVADYPFTTNAPVPGIAHHEDCPFQVIDLPPITADVMDMNLLNLVRGSDLVFLFADLGNDDLVEDLNAVLERFRNGKTRFGKETYLDEEDLGVTYTRTFLVLNKSDHAGLKNVLKSFVSFFLWILSLSRFLLRPAKDVKSFSKPLSNVWESCECTRRIPKRRKLI